MQLILAGVPAETYDFRTGNSEELTARAERVFSAQVQKLFGHIPPGAFFNWDARGHFLKVEAEHTPEGALTDWGGDMILAGEIE